jgi:hypothetical protein
MSTASGVATPRSESAQILIVNRCSERLNHLDGAALLAQFGIQLPELAGETDRFGQCQRRLPMSVGQPRLALVLVQYGQRSQLRDLVAAFVGNLVSNRCRSSTELAVSPTCSSASVSYQRVCPAI